MTIEKTIAGVDYSLTSPAIFVDNTAYAFGRKTWQGEHTMHGIKFVIMEYPSNYKTPEERYHNLALWSLGILQHHNVDHVYLEGYSMGSTGSRVFDIAECCGHLKMSMHLSDIPYTLVAPTTLKKWFYGKGNAKKHQMHEAFIAETGFSLTEELFTTKSESNLPAPITDVVDAFGLWKYGLEQEKKSLDVVGDENHDTN